MSAETKAVVCVAEMARMVYLSRARFYQLVRAGTFPEPVYQSGRPVYTEELQHICLEVRRRNCGIDGKPVLFYSRRRVSKREKLAAKPGDVSALMEGLNALGLTTATAAQVQVAIEELFPQGTTGIEQGEALRAVFLEIRRQNSADKVE